MYVNSEKDLLLAKSKRVIDCHAGHFLKKKAESHVNDKYQIRNFNHLNQPKIFATITF